MSFELVLLLFFFACWGSFLNVIAYRLIHSQSIILPRSYCPSCGKTLSWYELIPILSYIFQRGRCRSCNASISWLYPFIEILTSIVLTALIYLVDMAYWGSYGIFFSALIITIRTDFEYMLISRYTTLALIPYASIAAAAGFLEITLSQSMLGAGLGFGVPWLFARIYARIRGIEGIGEGDFDLLAMIGSFIGAQGLWFSIFCGALFGSVYSIMLLARGADIRATKMPFGPFLAISAILFVFSQQTVWYQTIYRLILGT